MRGKCASDQTSAGWNIGVEVERAISARYEIGKGGPKAHHSQIQRSRRWHENLRGEVHSVR